MANRKFNFLSSGEPPVKEIIKKDVQDTPIIDTEVIEYIIKEFPDTSKNISKSLLGLKDTLEKSIDFIEDKSSEIVKNNRDFKLSGKYRETCIKLHGISKSLKEYVNWMNVIENNENNLKKSEFEIDNDIIINETYLDKYIPIYNDFTGLTPLKFALNDLYISVENWDDLIMKTASMLTKYYKDNKESDTFFPQHTTVVIKKSNENELRDTIIEMLSEYKISLDEFKILTN